DRLATRRCRRRSGCRTGLGRRVGPARWRAFERRPPRGGGHRTGHAGGPQVVMSGDDRGRTRRVGHRRVRLLSGKRHRRRRSGGRMAQRRSRSPHRHLRRSRGAGGLGVDGAGTVLVGPLRRAGDVPVLLPVPPRDDGHRLGGCGPM
ncbi:MAG: hypothetical protein AVDCRST_MAG10-606, partial [uncultured Acidimicrobiales bacterium]